jgi:hypothetical protein
MSQTNGLNRVRSGLMLMIIVNLFQGCLFYAGPVE